MTRVSIFFRGLQSLRIAGELELQVKLKVDCYDNQVSYKDFVCHSQV